MSRGQQFPNANEPIAMPDRKISPAWFSVLNSLWRKASGGTVTAVTASAPIASSGGTAPNMTLNASGVTAGSYTNANLTVTAKGLISAAASGSAGTGTVTHTGNLTANNLVVGNGVADLKTVAATNGQIPIGKTSDGSVTLASLTAGSNITITPGAASVTIAATAGAGGTGNSLYRTAFGSEPGSPNTGDADLYTNAPYLSRYSGSAWVPYGPIWAFTNPSLVSWAWVNQGGATVSTTNGAIVLQSAITPGTDWRLRVTNAPATPYTLSAWVIPHMLNQATHRVMVGWYESGSGKFSGFTLTQTGDNNPAFEIQNWNSTGGFSGNGTLVNGATRQANSIAYNQPLLIQLTDDGVNRTAGFSTDGFTIYTLFAVARTTFITPDQFLIGADPNNASYACGLTLLSWVTV